MGKMPMPRGQDARATLDDAGQQQDQRRDSRQTELRPELGRRVVQLEHIIGAA